MHNQMGGLAVLQVEAIRICFDAISRLYAGTPALKRDFTRTGKRTKLGALDDGMNSLQRYYLNNFLHLHGEFPY